VRSGSKPQRLRFALERRQNEGDVLLEGHAQLLRAARDLLPVHRAGEALRLHLADYRVRRDLGQGPVGLDERGSDDQPAQLVDGVERLREGRDAGGPGVGGVAQDRLEHLAREAPLLEDPASEARVLLGRRVPLVIEVVEEAHRGPERLVSAQTPRVPAHRGFHGQRVLSEPRALRVLVQEGQLLLAGRERALDVRRVG
jgi:hypothetical protein